MNSKLDILITLYEQSKKKYLYDNVDIIENTDVEKENNEITIKHIYTQKKYMIFLIVTNRKIIFNGLLNESKYELNEEYQKYLYDLNNMSEVEFIEKYYNLLKKNL